ncbi:MAG: hypothetical protein Q7T82_07995 [Armatimonadota bacterium]|nr:hypothetical protein [Armatimonadota bacterium]
MKRLRLIDWDAVAGVIAAVVALILHLVNVVDQDVLLTIVLVILAIMLLQNIRRDARDEQAQSMIREVNLATAKLQDSIAPREVRLVGPSLLRQESSRFARQSRGTMIWFNVCLLMFEPQSLFDALLRPAVDNPLVTEIRFTLNRSERDRWETAVRPKLDACAGRDKVAEPLWTEIEEGISFITGETSESGAPEAHVSFWGEPFMARARSSNVPRYILHVYSNSDLIPRLLDLERQYRLA